MLIRSTILLCLGVIAVHAQTRFTVRNLVSDIPGTADQTDPNLKNPWGLVASSTSPFWITNNHTGTSTVYNSDGLPFPIASPLIVTIPTADGEAAASSPTGIAFNDTGGFELQPGKPASFLFFASEDGTISAWNAAVDSGAARTVINNSGIKSVYKGLAVTNSQNGPRLYAANFSAGTIDVFDSNFKPVAVPDSIRDPLIPGFGPFNVQRIGQRLYVTYAKQGGEDGDDVPGAGNGYVLVFSLEGELLAKLIEGGALNSPWGMAIAPDFFGDFAGTLLVANFGDGKINAYDSCSGAWLGTLQGTDAQPLQIPGLWALRFGNGHNGGESGVLYFTAGIAGPDDLEDHGVFGNIRVAPAATPTPTDVEVNIQSLKFMPDVITLAAGASIRWKNSDGFAHNVKADDGQFQSPLINGNESFTQKFATPGSYDYHCTIHPFMKGKVVVQ